MLEEIAQSADRLNALGYQFADPESAFVPAGSDAPGRITEMERRLGTFPLLVRAWYESMASVNFSQAEVQLRGSTGPDVNGLGSHPEMIMLSLDRCWQLWQLMCREHEEHCEMMARLKDENPEWYHSLPPGARETRPPSPFLPTGGAASNCEPKGFSLPSLGVDGVMYNDGSGDMYFIDVLRRCFEWGGFPFCHYYAAGNKPLPWEALPNWERLIPLLREGLADV